MTPPLPNTLLTIIYNVANFNLFKHPIVSDFIKTYIVSGSDFIKKFFEEQDTIIIALVFLAIIIIIVVPLSFLFKRLNIF
jgi:hypothetical protein